MMGAWYAQCLAGFILAIIFFKKIQTINWKEAID
jgi:hypothetical protein